MSHTTTMKAKLTNKEAIRTACQRLELQAPTEGDYRFYDGRTATGTLVKLPNWKYPVVIQSDGEVIYDNYNGAWGKATELSRFQQEYSAAVVEEQMGGMWAISREQQADGTLRLHLSR